MKNKIIAIMDIGEVLLAFGISLIIMGISGGSF